MTGRHVVAGLGVALFGLACSGDDSGGSGGSGGQSAAGGTGGVSGSAGAGGSVAGSGGSSGTGASSGSGGTSGSGAVSGSGGASGAGGSGAVSGSGGASGSGGSGGTSGSGGATGACGNATHQIFPPGAPWNTPIDSAPLDSESAAIISYLQSNHSTSARFQIDFSFNILEADASTPHMPFVPSGNFFSPDCDTAPPPVPPGGALEGAPGYACPNVNDEDCHLVVVDRDECRLFEMWRADIQGSTFDGGCQAVWDIDVVPPSDMRGQYCTSADAAGLPIAPLLFTADEVYDGEIPHALRFILPNSRIREDVFVAPGTHSTSATSGPSDAPPYTARLRLKASVDLSGLNSAAQVVAQALKTYGMFLADGGNITFTANGDTFTTRKWNDVGLGPHDLKSLEWQDFEVVELGTRFNRNDGSCSRTPIAQ